MQEAYVHKERRYFVIRMYAKGQTDETKDWVSRLVRLPVTTSSVTLMGKFSDGREELVYFNHDVPHWWYAEPKGRPFVITDELTHWKGIGKSE